MISDASSVPHGAQLEADICVIGGGPAAIAFALQFANDRRKVLVLESGGTKVETSTQDLVDGEQAGLPYFPLRESRYRLLGGSTFRWGARSAPFKPIDFEVRPWTPFSGWPLKREDLAPYYEQVFKLIGLKLPFAFEGDVWGQVNGKPPAIDPTLLQPTAFQFGKNVLFGQVYRDELAAAPNVQVVLNATVTKLRSDPGGRTVTHLDVAAPGGGRWQARARSYVLATGGIENARMLLLSDDANPAGLGNGRDHVGRYFMEHPTVSAGKITTRDGQALQDASSPGLVGGRLVEVGWALSPEVQEREKVLNAVTRVTAVLKNDPTQALRELVRNLRYRRLPQSLDWYQQNRWLMERLGVVMSNPGNIISNTVRHALGKPKRFNVDALMLELRIEQASNPDSRVTLTDTLDPLGLRLPRLHWALTRQDKATMQTAARLFDGELRRLGLGSLAVEPWLQSDELVFGQDMVGGYHHMGTTRMTADPAAGVVDADCRVHELDNLYVAGASVFPTSSYVNPTSTLLALSLRLADHLKARTS